MLQSLISCQCWKFFGFYVGFFLKTFVEPSLTCDRTFNGERQTKIENQQQMRRSRPSTIHPTSLKK
jgi:hypothetical protein